jgi:hypothetical protein
MSEARSTMRSRYVYAMTKPLSTKKKSTIISAFLMNTVSVMMGALEKWRSDTETAARPRSDSRYGSFCFN